MNRWSFRGVCRGANRGAWVGPCRGANLGAWPGRRGFTLPLALLGVLALTALALVAFTLVLGEVGDGGLEHRYLSDLAGAGHPGPEAQTTRLPVGPGYQVELIQAHHGVRSRVRVTWTLNPRIEALDWDQPWRVGDAGPGGTPQPGSVRWAEPPCGPGTGPGMGSGMGGAGASFDPGGGGRPRGPRIGPLDAVQLARILNERPTATSGSTPEWIPSSLTLETFGVDAIWMRGLGAAAGEGSPYGAASGVLVVPGDVRLGGTGELRGIVLAEGQVELGPEVVVRGAVAGGSGVYATGTEQIVGDWCAMEDSLEWLVPLGPVVIPGGAHLGWY